MVEINFVEIKETVKKRNEFLLENPELQSLQIEIDELLTKAGKDHYQCQAALQSKMLNTSYAIVKIF